MRDPNLIVGAPREASRRHDLAPQVVQAWRWVGWFGLILTIAGVGDWALAWIPVRLGSVEWEFGTIAASIAGMPLVTMGFAGLLASAVARGVRWQVVSICMILLVWAALVLAAVTIFALDVPIALAAVTGPARIGIVKATLKTIFLGLLFATAYIVAAVVALRRRP